MYSRIFKRPLDLLAAILLLLILSPIFIMVIVILYFTNDRQVFFVQPRPGWKGKIFRIIKFKTMNDQKDSNGNLLPPSKRITPIGKIIRNSSLDEIPQLINVIKGDLSIIGPRPLRVEYLPYYTTFQARRHVIRPGITGWAQVNGRNLLDWEERFECDVWYVDNVSFLLDLKILLLTIWKVVRREGVNEPKSGLVKPFQNIKLNS